MPLLLEQKQQVVTEVRELAGKANSLVLADMRGVNVAEITELRNQAREQSVVLRVVKNTLAARAFEDTEFAVLKDALRGPSLLGFSLEHPGAAAKLFKSFSKDNDNFTVTALSFGGQLLEAEQLDRLADIPTREQALSQLMGLLMAPVTNLARTLNDIPASLARVVDAVARTKN